MWAAEAPLYNPNNLTDVIDQAGHVRPIHSPSHDLTDAPVRNAVHPDGLEGYHSARMRPQVLLLPHVRQRATNRSRTQRSIPRLRVLPAR